MKRGNCALLLVSALCFGGPVHPGPPWISICGPMRGFTVFGAEVFDATAARSPWAALDG
jgi:hypothetical protein